MGESRVIFITVNISTEDEAEAAKSIDILSRVVLGLALEGIETTLEVTTGIFENEDADQGD